MGLRKRALVFGVLALVVYGLAAMVVTRVLLLSSLNSIETNGARENLARVRSAVQQEIGNLDSTTRDYASWDLTYAFARDRNAAYVRTELVDETLRNLRVQVFLIVDGDGRLVIVKSLDARSGGSLDGDELQRLQRLAGSLLKGFAPDSGVKGLARQGDDVLLFAARPVLTSEHRGPPRGVLLMARTLDAGEVERMGNTVHLPLQLLPVTRSEVGRVMGALEQDADGLVAETADNDLTNGYVALRDGQGRVVAVLKTQLARSVYQEGRRAALYFVAVILAMAGIMGAVMLVTLEAWLLRPIAQMSATAEHVTATGDLSPRVPLGKARDEISTLATSLNDMLQSLTNTQQELLEARESLRFEASHDTLTGLWNRAAIRDVLERELSRATRDGQWTTVMMVDADHFKQINDSFGHGAGDQALKSLARS